MATNEPVEQHDLAEGPDDPRGYIGIGAIVCILGGVFIALGARQDSIVVTLVGVAFLFLGSVGVLIGAVAEGVRLGLWAYYGDR